MSKGTGFVGLALLVSAFGCGSSNSSVPDGGTNVGGRGGGSGGTGGTTEPPPPSGIPTVTGVAGTTTGTGV
jgi:hypothetical protein